MKRVHEVSRATSPLSARRFGAFAVVLALLATVAFGFSAPAFADAPLRVALVMPGLATDQAWNQSGYEGLMMIQEALGAEVVYVESVPQPQQARTLTDFARRGYDVVIGHGGEFDAAVQQVASQFPDVKFVITNGYAAGPNVASLQIDHWQVSYLTGIVAGKMTETDRIAIVSGQEFQAVVDMTAGFRAGIASVNPDAQLSVSYTGSWDDIGRAKEAALAHIAEGADVIFPMLDLAFLGGIEAARERGVWALGFVKDHYDLAPETILTSGVENIAVAMLDFVTRIAEGEFQGAVHYIGLENPEAAGVGRYNEAVPQEVRDLVAQAAADIVAGRIVQE